MDNPSAVPAYVNGPTGQAPAQASSGEQPETSTTQRILIAWIPWIREWREVFECDHGRYYCLDPGDGLGTHIGDGDGIEVLETTEADCDRAMDEWFAKHYRPAVDDSEGIDMPGVGVVRPAEVSSVCAGRESAVGEVRLAGPADSADDQLFRDVRELGAAALDLAMAQIEPAAEGEPAFCTECVKDAYGSGVDIAHEDDCRVGRVLRAFARLNSQSPHKETAADGERPAAGVGSRPRGFTHVCGKCGERGGHWAAEPVGRTPDTLALNQVLHEGATAVVFTHQCLTAEGGAR